MVVPEGLEPPTPTLGKWRSVQLSYGTTSAQQIRVAAHEIQRQLSCSGGTTGKGSGATGTPSSTSAFASAAVA